MGCLLPTGSGGVLPLLPTIGMCWCSPSTAPRLWPESSLAEIMLENRTSHGEAGRKRFCKQKNNITRKTDTPGTAWLPYHRLLQVGLEAVPGQCFIPHLVGVCAPIHPTCIMLAVCEHTQGGADPHICPSSTHSSSPPACTACPLLFLEGEQLTLHRTAALRATLLSPREKSFPLQPAAQFGFSSAG